MLNNFLNYKNKVLSPKLGKMKGDRLYNLERNISVRISWILLKIFPRIHANYITVLSLLLLLSVFISGFFLQTSNLQPFFFVLQLCALYLISIADKVDGEIARATNNSTQKGLYYDRAVHFLFPFIFYFTVGHYFYVIGGSIYLFFITLLLGVLTQQLIFFGEARLLIGEKIRRNAADFKDFMVVSNLKKGRPMLFFRLIDYLTFMIYAWTLFFYVVLGVVSTMDQEVAEIFYLIHVIISLAVVSYKVFIYYPRHKLYTAEEASHLRNKG